MPGFVVCVPVQGGPSVAPCGDVEGVAHTPIVMQLPAPGSVQFDNAQTLFAFGFSGVLIMWMVGVAVGQILSVIRRG